MDKYKQLCEMDINDLIGQLTNPQNHSDMSNDKCIQPDSNIGEFGQISSPETTKITISQEEDGSLNIKTAGFYVTLESGTVEALRSFFNTTDNMKGEDNGSLCRK